MGSVGTNYRLVEQSIKLLVV